MDRLSAGERVLVGEGYVMELERRGYVSAGPWIPECVLTITWGSKFRVAASIIAEVDVVSLNIAPSF